ncbi:hypothetical protein AA102526_1514 [Asaia lannensis NBRC 102526]|nr:hypothetical protein AA102526_1514 [Asaia lannensis NBRC 102526]
MSAAKLALMTPAPIRTISGLSWQVWDMRRFFQSGDTGALTPRLAPTGERDVFSTT